jgi:hypothetical protein
MHEGDFSSRIHGQLAGAGPIFRGNLTPQPPSLREKGEEWNCARSEGRGRRCVAGSVVVAVFCRFHVRIGNFLLTGTWHCGVERGVARTERLGG